MMALPPGDILAAAVVGAAVLLALTGRFSGADPRLGRNIRNWLGWWEGESVRREREIRRTQDDARWAQRYGGG